MPSLPEQLKGLVAAFQSRPDDKAEQDLRSLRLELARAWAAADPLQATRMSQTELFEACRVLRASGLRNLELVPEEQRACAPWRALLQERWPSPEAGGLMMACSLFFPAHEIGLRPEIEGTPMWMLSDYIEYLFEPPALLLSPGESLRYARHLEAALHHLEPALDVLDPQVEDLVVRQVNLIQAYFHDENLRGLMAARAQLIEKFLRRRGCLLEHSAPARAPGKPRIGILAPAYVAQTESSFALANLAGLDRDAFEVFLYALHSAPNSVEDACRSHADHFTVLPADLAQQVARIRSDQIDLILILTNIGAVTNQMALLSAHRLARVQVASMATPVTTGFSQIDAFLSSELNDGEGAQAHYSERLVQIAGSLNHYAFSEELPAAAAPSRAGLGIGQNAVVFFSALNFFKILPELAGQWAEVLSAVPDSVLLLLPFNPNWSSHYPEHAFRRRLTRDMGARSVDATRVHVLNPVPTRGDVLALMRLADVYLDGYPFAGACSIYDPLLAGLPAVAREGTTARSRHGAIMLRMMGLDELVTHSDADYVKLAIALAQDPGRRTAVRARMQACLQQGNPVLDSKDLGRRLQPVLRQLAEADSSVALGLREVLQTRSQRLAKSRLRSLTDTEIVHSVLLPCFPPATAASPLHMVDVGACYGEMAAPFLHAGWTADLFEPDPACREVMGSALAGFGERAQMHPLAVSDEEHDSISFYKAKINGVSGLGPSPYGDTEGVIRVPAVRLGEHLRTLKTSRVDFLKVDAEGQDLKVLTSHDFAALPPRFVFIELNSEFPEQKLEHIREGFAAMRARGYQALLLRYEDEGTFKQGIWDRYWLKDAQVVQDLSADQIPLIANVIFYREDDTDFVRRFVGTLDRALAAAA